MINAEELLFVVDEDNNPLSPLPRAQVHAAGHWHRTSHIWIANKKLEILCQRRSQLKDTNPGYWEPFFGGHMGPEETYELNAITELQEELGISISTEGLIPYLVYKRTKAKEFQGIFYIIWNGKISELTLEKDEVDEVKFIPTSYIKMHIQNKTHLWSFQGYELDLLRKLEELKY